MTGFNDSMAINGTYGEVWVDGDQMSEAKSARLEINPQYTAIKQCRNLVDGQKLTGIECEGEIGLYHVDSNIVKKVALQLKKGIVPDITIISKIDDPNALGAERVAAYHCKFNKITLADWERGNIGERSYSFTFSDYDLLDLI